jgi:osmotically-inducible protein OsmY
MEFLISRTFMKTDLQLQQDVITELKWQPSVNAADIGVGVHQGVVTLSGHVTNYAEKFAAEQATQRIAGVKALTINIDVTLLGLGARTDIDMARSAEDALRWVTRMPKDSTKIMVENDWITLSGKVEWDYQRRHAVDTVRHLSGVKGVRDLVLIKTQSHSNEIKRSNWILRRRSSATMTPKMRIYRSPFKTLNPRRARFSI